MSSATPMVSVVMPVRNGERYIADAVRSVLGQTLCDIELLVIDDASSDRTLDAVAGFADPRVRVLRSTQRRGVSASRNLGMAEARAPYVAFLDADDLAYPSRLARQWDYLQAHPSVAVLGSHVDCVDEAGKLLYSEPEGLRPCDPVALRLGLLERACILPSTAMARRAVLLEAGGFAPMDYAEDHDLWCRVAIRHELAILPDRLVAYRYHANQATQRKLRAAFDGTQACIRRATAAYLAAGLIGPGQAPPALTLLDRLRGAQGTYAASCLEWARLYRWAFRQPRRGLALAGMAAVHAPLSRQVWTVLLACAWQAAAPSNVQRAVRWYGQRLRAALAQPKAPPGR